MNNYIYSDRFNVPGAGQDLGVATVVEKHCDDDAWRISYRKDEPEKDALPEALLQRRLQAQKHVKTTITGRRQPEIANLLSDEKQRAKRSEKARRERLQFHPSSSSSSDTDGSDNSDPPEPSSARPA